MATRRTSERLRKAQNPLRTILGESEPSKNHKRLLSCDNDTFESPRKRQRRQDRPHHQTSPQELKRARRDTARHTTALQRLEPSRDLKPSQERSVKRVQKCHPVHASRRQKKSSAISASKPYSISHWIGSGRWPREDFDWNDSMSFPLARKKSSSSLRRKASESSSGTPSDQKPREEKSALYTNPRYETLLATKGSSMDESQLGITSESKALCQTLLNEQQELPVDSLFRDDIFRKTCQKLQNRNESRVIQDITRMVVPSAETFATYGAEHLENLIENVNEGWNESIPLIGPRPQPDYSVGFKPSAFTEDQRKRLQPCIGGLMDASFFVATWRMYFPFLTCEVKCGAGALDVADRQNAHSATLAARGVVELYRAVKREKELHREILAFSVSHDNRTIRIYGYYPLIDKDKTTYYRHLIRTFDFTELDGKEKWTAYRFTKNVYDIFMPMHLKRICSAVEELQSDPSFELSQESELRFQEEPGQQLSQHSEADSVSAVEADNSFISSQDVTPNTSFTEREFKKPRRKQKG